jgi:RNA polymerase sigma factor (sigma-70 family)
VAAKPDETLPLWQEYRRSGDKALRERLILTYAPLVKYVAGRVGSGLPSHVDESDLVQYGLLGLIGAIERYDPDRDVKFETYAIARIKGSIIDELRALDWVPCGALRARHRARDPAASRRARPRRRRGGRQKQLGKSPTSAAATSAARRSPRSTSSGPSRRREATELP